VPGNHEYYGHAAPGIVRKMRSLAARLGLHLLDRNSITVDGIRFLGCTLWTDLRAGDNQDSLMEMAGRYVMDYRMIRVPPSYRCLTPRDTIRWHSQAMSWLTEELSDTSVPTVVISHHSPSMRSISPAHAGSPFNAAFSSNLDEFVASSTVPLWIHGHTHHCVDYSLGGTRIVSNQRGYPDEPACGFDPSLVVEFDPVGK
jgi:hypothetical protein